MLICPALLHGPCMLVSGYIWGWGKSKRIGMGKGMDKGKVKVKEVNEEVKRQR